jgi:hypothetical protein
MKNILLKKLPYLFQLAEIDNSRNGKLGMEIGSARERIVIALLIYKFGEKNIKTDIAITKSEIDWNRDNSIIYNSYDRWVEHWQE